MRPLDPPAEPAPLSVETLRSGSGGGRTVTRDLAAGRSELVFDWDCGGLARLPNGLLYEDTSVASYGIAAGFKLHGFGRRKCGQRGRVGGVEGHRCSYVNNGLDGVSVVRGL